MLYIFGYGSLVCDVGINGRGLSRNYYCSDLTDAWITGYKRDWNACLGAQRFLGLSPDSSGTVNGVIFQLAEKDLEPFALSEGSETGNPDPVYTFVDVRRQLGIDPECSVVLEPTDKVLTCVTVHPSFAGTVSKNYFELVRFAVASRGEGFFNEFWSKTPHPSPIGAQRERTRSCKVLAQS
jgi:hypothetical protein